MESLGRLVVVGVGLIGGSFALEMKRAGCVREVVGVGRSPDNLALAVRLGVIDRAETDLAHAVKDADMVLVATPVGQMAQVFATLAPVLPPHAIVTDAGSTKTDVAALMATHLPQHLAQCVPAHPIAGSEQSGAAAAHLGLYQQRRVVLTPLAQTAPAAAATVTALWQAAGASVHTMTPAVHDAVFASVSHLPHVLAFAYVGMVAHKPDANLCFDFAASGFRDFTRIAGSHPEMWRDICLANRDAVLSELTAFRAQLDQLEAHITARNGEALVAAYRHASTARTAWLARFTAPLGRTLNPL